MKVVKANFANAIDIFKWRNDRAAILYSASQKKIQLSEHKKWFKKNLVNSKNKIFIGLVTLKKRTFKIGMVRFDEKKNTVNVSINLNPKFRGMNLSKKLLKMCIKKFNSKNSLTAKIHKNNERSINCFSSCGFILFKIQKKFMIFKKR